MAGFNFYMERQRPGQVREPGYIRASLQVDRPSARDDRAPFTNEQYRDDPAARRQLIDKHIGIVRNMLANRNPPVIMDEQAAARAHDMGMRAHTTNPDTIAQTVLSAVTTNLPSAEQQALRNQLAANNTDENQYYAALGRVGAGYNNIATLMAAYRDIMAREAANPRSGNMMQGVNDSGYLSSISMSNYTSTSFFASGMTYGTFEHMRSHPMGFNRQNIQHAVEDNNTQGFTPNDRSALVSNAALDRLHPEGRVERNRLIPQVRSEVRNDPVMQGLVAELGRATTPEQRAAIQARIDAQIAIRRESSGLGAHERGAPEAARPHIRRLGTGAIYDELMKMTTDPAARARLMEMRRQAEARVGQPRTAEEIQRENAALLAEARTPEARQHADRIIAYNQRDLEIAQRTQEQVRSSQQRVAATEDLFAAPAAQPTPAAAQPTPAAAQPTPAAAQPAKAPVATNGRVAGPN